MRLNTTDPDLVQCLKALEHRAQQAGPDQHLRLRADLQRLLARAVRRGDPVQARIKTLGRQIEEDAMEEMFDNMPV